MSTVVKGVQAAAGKEFDLFWKATSQKCFALILKWKARSRVCYRGVLVTSWAESSRKRGEKESETQTGGEEEENSATNIMRRRGGAGKEEEGEVKRLIWVCFLLSESNSCCQSHGISPCQVRSGPASSGKRSGVFLKLFGRKCCTSTAFHESLLK